MPRAPVPPPSGPTEDPEVLLSVRGASRIYAMGEVEVAALRDVDLDLASGEFLIIQGPSGCGKSTLLNLLGGMDRATSGEVRYRGQDLGRLSDHELTLYRRHRVGFVFQFYNLVPTLTALENIQVATEIASDPLDPREALATVDLTDRADHFPAQLSGGQQQRVAIARALASNPELLLCDEPTGALDLHTSRQVLGVLMRVNEELGKTVVLVTHNAALSALGHRVAWIRDGSIREVRVQTERPDVESVEW